MSGDNRKRIVAISASPSKGRNSDMMLDHFIKGVLDTCSSEIVLEKFYMEEIYFDYYDYENRCGAQETEEDFGILAEKFKNADGVIIATPTYNFSVPAKLKNFIDRIRFMALDLDKENFLGQPVGKFKNHNMYFLVSGGTPKLVHHLLFFLFPDFWLTIIFMYYGSLRFGSYYSGDTKTFKNERILKKCYKKGCKFAKKVL